MGASGGCLYIYVYIHMCVNAPEWCQPAMNLLLEPARGPPAPKKGRPAAEKTRANTLTTAGHATAQREGHLFILARFSWEVASLSWAE